MPTIELDEATRQLATLVDAVVGGDEVIITRNGRPAARLVPITGGGVPTFGSARGLIRTADDFDAPLEDFGPYER